MNSVLSRTILVTHEKLTRRKILMRMEELNRTQWLSRDALLELQREKLRRLVAYAYEHVPYYRRTFDAVGFHPQDLCADFNCFFQLPVLNKAIIRENWDDLVTTDPVRRKGMSKLATSGSTGQPLVFMQDGDYRDAVTADIQRHLGWAGWHLGDVHAMIWGVNPKRTHKQKVRAQAIDWVWNRFQMDAFRMTEAAMAAFTQQIRLQKPGILFGYATCIHQFAQYVRQQQIPDITFDGIFTTAELLLPPVRDYIEEVFRCKILNRYGTLELGGIACECEAHTGLHVSMENNLVEILNNGAPAEPGQVGDIVVTNLNNLGMPFIRYEIADAGAWYEGEDCPCGRKSLRLTNLEGRRVETFVTRDGRKVWSGFAGAGFRCLTHPAIKRFQVIQKTLDSMILKVVADGPLPEPVVEEVSQAFRSAYGEATRVQIDYVDDIPALPSGKHQYAISEIGNS